MSSYIERGVKSIGRKYGRAKSKLLDGALRSEYMKRTYDFLPTWFISYLIRFFIDFMVYHRLKFVAEEETWFITISNLIISIIISVAATLCSPFFYDIALKYEKRIQKFTDHVTRNMTWNYFNIWQTRIGVTVGVIGIIILSWIEVTSIWLIQCIVHTIICGFILGQIEEWQIHLTRFNIETFHAKKEMFKHQHYIKFAEGFPASPQKAEIKFSDESVMESYYQPTPCRAIIINPKHHYYNRMPPQQPHSSYRKKSKTNQTKTKQTKTNQTKNGFTINNYYVSNHFQILNKGPINIHNSVVIIDDYTNDQSEMLIKK